MPSRRRSNRPPELGADVAERGIVLTGGGALLKRPRRLIEEETGLPVINAEDPDLRRTRRWARPSNC